MQLVEASIKNGEFMRKAILILLLAVVSSSAAAEWNEGYKIMLRSLNSANEISISAPMTSISIRNEECLGLPMAKAMECVSHDFNNPQKIAKDMRIFGPISKNVENLYASKIEKIVGIKVREAKQGVKSKFHLYVDITVTQIAPKYLGENIYLVDHKARLEEDGVSITGRKGGILLDSWGSLKSVSDVGSIEGEIYRSIDDIIGKIKDSFAEASELCMKEKCIETTQP